MTPPTSLLLDAPITGPADPADDGFDLDLTVLELTTPVAALRCGTGDGCGGTCEKSACTTSAFDPR